MIKSTKSILRQYILPSIWGMVGTSLYVLGDTLLVGRKLGQAGLAALNISIPLINVLTGLGLLVGVGGASLMVIKRAQNQKHEGDQLFSKSMVSALVIGLLLLVLSLLFTAVLSGVSLGIQPLISEAYGKKNKPMIKHYGFIGVITALILGSLILLIGQLMPGLLAMIFIEDKDVIHQAIKGIRLYFLAFPLTALNLVFTVYLQSQKQTLKAFLLSLQRGLIWIIILLVLFSNLMGIHGVWLVKLCAEAMTLLIGLFLFLPKKKQMISY